MVRFSICQWLSGRVFLAIFIRGPIIGVRIRIQDIGFAEIIFDPVVSGEGCVKDRIDGRDRDGNSSVSVELEIVTEG